MTLYDRVVSPLDARPELISCATENEIFDMHYEKTCSGMNSFRNGMNLFRIRMNSFRTGMKSFRIDTGIWGNEKCQKIRLFM